MQEYDVRNLAVVALGHSVGEFAALCMAEALRLEDGVRLLVSVLCSLLRTYA